MEKLIHSNTELGKVFETFENDIEKMKKLDDLNEKFGQIEDLVVSLDNLIHVSEFEEILKEMSGVANRLSKDKLETISAKVI